MSENHQSDIPPVRIHFARPFPIETRTLTNEEEYAIIEILKVEYGIDDNEGDYDVTFYVTGIKSFSVSDDDQECLISWTLKPYNVPDASPIAIGQVSTGRIEMGERFDECETTAFSIPEGDYLFDILYI